MERGRMEAQWSGAASRRVVVVVTMRCCVCVVCVCVLCVCCACPVCSVPGAVQQLGWRRGRGAYMGRDAGMSNGGLRADRRGREGASEQAGSWRQGHRRGLKGGRRRDRLGTGAAWKNGIRRGMGFGHGNRNKSMPSNASNRRARSPIARGGPRQLPRCYSSPACQLPSSPARPSPSCPPNRGAGSMALQTATAPESQGRRDEALGRRSIEASGRTWARACYLLPCPVADERGGPVVLHRDPSQQLRSSGSTGRATRR